MTRDPAILAVNCGSASVRCSWYLADDSLHGLGTANATGLATRFARFQATDGTGELIRDEPLLSPHVEDAIDVVLTHIETWDPTSQIALVAHRIAQPPFGDDSPTRLRSSSLAQLEADAREWGRQAFGAIAAIYETRQRWRSAQQFLCSDTHFFRSLPPTARTLGLPQGLDAAGYRRRGMFGLACESILSALIERVGVKASTERLVIAHLGHGSAIAAIANGQPLDTTGGSSSLGGPMGATGSGDIDPGVLTRLWEQQGLDAHAAWDLFGLRSGLLGRSGWSGDMRELLTRRDNADTAAALALYCHSVRKHLAGLAASTGGVDRLVFTGGIGANSELIRTEVCSGLAYMGIILDADANRRSAFDITAPGASVRVNVMDPLEELAMARQTWRMARDARAAHGV